MDPEDKAIAIGVTGLLCSIIDYFHISRFVMISEMSDGNKEVAERAIQDQIENLLELKALK